jgi:hypothetical protein
LKAIVLKKEIQMFKVFSLIYRWGNLRKKLLIKKKRIKLKKMVENFSTSRVPLATYYLECSNKLLNFSAPV